MWVRGLKLNDEDTAHPDDKSHPMWVRGLKLLFQNNIYKQEHVAPHVGAWIET